MSAPSLAARITQAPEPHDADHARDALAAIDIAPAEPARALLLGAFGCSPYLARLGRGHPGLLRETLETPPDSQLQQILAAFSEAGVRAADAAALDAALRRAKRRLHLLTALADLGGVWGLEAASEALSDGADAAIRAAFRAHARFMAQSGRLPEALLGEEGLEGLFVIALGKLGSRELNYSSDVDLAVFFDRAPLVERGVEEPGQLCARLTRRAVGALEEQTEDGYVLRVDLRLRPDPASTPPALSVDAAANYYESFAQTWERAAWIKARPCAGAPGPAEAFMNRVRPFVWRRTMDYAAIEEIEGLMRQIEAASGGHTKPAGFDLKRGPGGIRQIEFFAQTQQLLLGGRDPSVRAPRPLDALEALERRGDVPARDRRRLTSVYRALRVAENRLQMVEDQQTHHAPVDPERRLRAARICGRGSLQAFDDWLARDTGEARAICQDLFGPVDENPREAGLIFDGPDPPAPTLEKLEALGFSQPEQIWETVRGWQIGKPRATRSERARALIKRLAPRVVIAAAETGHPNAAFLRFSEFLNGLPAGISLLSMLDREPQLLSDIVDALGLAPRLAKALARRPEALEAFVAPASEALEAEDIEAGAQRAVGSARDFEEALDNTRRFARETLLRVGIATLRGQEAAGEAGRARVRVAESLVSALLPAARAEVERIYGALDAAVAIIGMGSFGAGEMTYASDLDLMLIFEPGDMTQSQGDGRQLTVETWCVRVLQRLVSALSVETAEGPLFNVDLQLRPSGNAGPVVVRLNAFERYYRDEAWTWEMMALTRARPVAGDEALRARAATALRELLAAERDPVRTAADVADMRDRLSREKPPRGAWDLKRAPGGQIDLEFTVQHLQLVHASRHPEVLSPSLFDAVNALANAGVISQDQAGELARAARLNLDLSQLFALAVEDRFDPETAPEKLKLRAARAGGVDSFEALEALLADTRRRVRAAYDKFVLSSAGARRK